MMHQLSPFSLSSSSGHWLVIHIIFSRNEQTYLLIIIPLFLGNQPISPSWYTRVEKEPRDSWDLSLPHRAPDYCN
jgi:hypothetical protein